MAVVQQIEQWEIGRLIPYLRNARTHSDAQINQLCASIKEWGWTVPVLVSVDGQIIAGHGRVMAAKQMGLAEVPVMLADGWTDAQIRAYTIADNKLAMNAGWDQGLLKVELSELRDMGVVLQTAGFSTVELDAMLGAPVDERDAQAVAVAPVSRAGDLWLLGDHRLLCGNSTKRHDVSRLMGDKQADIVFTDPPYGVAYKGGAKLREALASDEIGTTIYADALPNLSFAAADHAALYLWYADAHAQAAAAAAAAAGYVISAQIIWVKNNAQFVTSAHYKGKHEPCFYAHRRGKTAKWIGPNNEVTLWEVARASKNEFHPTQKPVELAQRALKNSSERGDIVLDMFGGSGSTCIAAETVGRTCYAMELAPQYVDIAVLRWQKFTGSDAILQDGGKTFAQIQAERCAEPVRALS